VAPKEGPGARIVFTAFFPRINQERLTSRGADKGGTPPQHRLRAGTRLLVAEDNPENVVLLQAYLQGLPLSLDFASNGVEAFEKRRQTDYDLVLMDIQMPVMDGYVATREIRAWERHQQRPRVPIVALTAHALSGAAQESKDAGCDGHVSKPVEKYDLVEAIARFAAAPRPAPPAQPAAPSGIEALRPRFLANRKTEIGKLREALALRDFSAIRTIGHNCKGIGTGYGFPEISKLGAAIETAARACDPEATAESLAEFERCVLAACGESTAVAVA
jgi:CheY-like chemotaxis protein